MPFVLMSFTVIVLLFLIFKEHQDLNNLEHTNHKVWRETRPDLNLSNIIFQFK